MATTTVRDRDQKIADAKYAYDIFREELGSKDLRTLITKLAEFPAPGTGASEASIVAYASLVQGSMTLAQVAAANDRTALTASVALMAGTVAREREDQD